MWEETNNIRLVELFGPFVIIIFLIIIGFLAYKYIKQTGVGSLYAIAITYLVFYTIFKNWGDLYNFYELRIVPQIRSRLLELIALICGAVLAIGGIKIGYNALMKIFGKKRKES